MSKIAVVVCTRPPCPPHRGEAAPAFSHDMDIAVDALELGPELGRLPASRLTENDLAKLFTGTPAGPIIFAARRQPDRRILARFPRPLACA